MKENTDRIKSQLTEIASLQAKTTKAGSQIYDSALHRLDEVNSRVNEIRPKVMTDKDLADEYLDLIDERAHLLRVIARGES